jgi:hypothetical protein
LHHCGRFVSDGMNSRRQNELGYECEREIFRKEFT